jgi:hypothetical protein
VSRSYWEPEWTTDDSRRRWRERKVVLRVCVRELQLPDVVRARFVELLGKRYVDGWAVVVADRLVVCEFSLLFFFKNNCFDRYESKEENRLYSLLLMRTLLTTSWEAHPRFVRVGETRAALANQHNEKARGELLKRAQETTMTVFTFLHQ